MNRTVLQSDIVKCFQAAAYATVGAFFVSGVPAPVKVVLAALVVIATVTVMLVLAPPKRTA